jgi:hypothetical protein
MGTERARDPMFEQSPLTSGPCARAGLLREGPGRKWLQVGGGRACTCAPACSHGCAGEFDSSRLLTSHWENNNAKYDPFNILHKQKIQTIGLPPLQKQLGGAIISTVHLIQNT